MDSVNFRNANQLLVATILLAALLAALGCTSNAPANKLNQKTGPVSQIGSAASSTAPDIDLNCVINHLQNPPESFHYSYKKQSSNSVEEDAEVTPENINGSFTNNSLTHPQAFQGAPHEVWSNLMGIGGMASLFALVHSSSAVVNEGTEKGVNGYDTFKYSIDTARGNSTEQGLYASVLGKGGFEKGMVWVAGQGCPIKLIIDEELHGKDGSLLDKSHYEEAMIKR